MSQDSERERRSANIIVEAGKILQRLKPPRLAVLLFITNDEIETQTEMADILDVSSSTITTHLQKLENLPVSLTEKRRTYKITPAGDTVLGYYAQMLNRLGKNLRTVNWDNETDRDQIGELLAPLHNSRTIVPFLVLASIARHSTVEGRIGIFAQPQPVNVKDIIADVKEWQEERGETATRKQVRWLLGRFEEAGTISFDDGKNEVRLEDDGKEHAKLLEQVIELIEDHRKESESGRRRPTEASSSLTQQDSASTRPQTIDQRTDAGRNVGPQLGLQGFYEGGQEIESAENPTIVPAYGVASSNSEESPPVLALTPTVTAEDLAAQTERIRREHGDDTELKLFWTTLSPETRDTDRTNERSQTQC